jgi:hypothetical protein
VTKAWVNHADDDTFGGGKRGDLASEKEIEELRRAVAITRDGLAGAVASSIVQGKQRVFKSVLRKLGPTQPWTSRMVIVNSD